MQPDSTTVNHGCYYQDLIYFRKLVEVLLNQAGQELPSTFPPSLRLLSFLVKSSCISSMVLGTTFAGS